MKFEKAKSSTDVRKHPRKGTSGVRKHTRKITQAASKEIEKERKEARKRDLEVEGYGLEVTSKGVDSE